jgi:hypothetical protein
MRHRAARSDEDQPLGLRARVYLAAAAILVAGLTCGTVIYFTAEESLETGVGYVVVDGKIVAIPPGSSKTYVRELRRFGGKTAVLFDEVNRWFAGLWQGRALGVTIGWLSAAVSFALALFARYRL